MQNGSPYFSYILGGLGGGGVICVWYGLQRLRMEKASKTSRRLGLVMVNAGIMMIAGSLYLITAMK